MQLLDGKLTANILKDEIAAEVSKIISNGGKKPHLAAILVGNNGASETYVNAKVKACEKVGFRSTLIRLKEDVSEEKLIKNYPDIPVFPLNGEKAKISAAWLIERCGFKGKRIKNVGMHSNQSLILVNYGNATGTELWNYAKEVKKKVFNKFKIKLEEEVNLIN